MRAFAKGLALSLVLGAAATSIALAGPELVPFPDGYLEDFVHYDSVDRQVNAGQIGELYANQAVMDAIRAGTELPLGSVLVMELHKAQMEGDAPLLGADGRRIKDGLSVVAVMLKCEGCGEEYADDLRNGNWEYAFFDPTTKALIDRDYQGCFSCHKPLAGDDFVFSLSALKAAAAK